ncbi:MAG: hypothetical protein ACE14S_07740 [Candidatus Bathyarchaeia archaeon]
MVALAEKRILQSLLEKNIIGEKHTSEDNATKCLPKHLRGEAKKALKKLTREGYIIQKPTSYGMEVSLNPHRVAELRRMLSET